MASSELTTANETIARQAKELAIAEIKNAGTLANNLCPDHRDKQKGQPCLACTIETLNRKLATKEAELLTLRAIRDMLILDGHVEHSKDDLPGYLRALIDALIECRAELLACRADAERLDWLEDVIRCYWLRIQSQPSGDDVWHRQGKGLRAAIDAAIKAGAQS